MMRAAALIALIGNLTVGSAAVSNPAPAAPHLPEDALKATSLAVASSLRPMARKAPPEPVVLPPARWDGKPGRDSWSREVIMGLRTHASVLPNIVPRDISKYCPAYPSADRQGREAFWVGLISALAWHESTHRPTAVGGGDLWYGLTQIYPDTARRYGCKARTGAALKDPEDNLSCALRIMAVTVPRDRVISERMKGVAADWGPFHSRRKRTDMMQWTRSQPYCVGLARSLRPIARPDAVFAERLAEREAQKRAAILAKLGATRPEVRPFAPPQQPDVRTVENKTPATTPTAVVSTQSEG